MLTLRDQRGPVIVGFIGQVKCSLDPVDIRTTVPKEMEERPQGVLRCQLPLKELNLRSFTLPCTIDSLNFYAMADLGASANIMPRSMVKHLKLTNLKKTDMLVEMVDMTKKAPVGIVENVLVKINKFGFPSDFMIIDMLGDPNEIVILGRPFLATIHARNDVFDIEISLGVGDDMIVFYMNSNVHRLVVLVKNACMISDVQGEIIKPLEIGNDLFSYESPLCLEFKKHNYLCLTKQNNEDTFVSDDMQEDHEGEKGMTKEYTAVFDNENEQLANEFELSIGNKGYIMDDKWEKYERVHEGTPYPWHDGGHEEEEK
ncbi:putative ribonuclease H-like domain-containing protein [Tanacetum coccineum]